MAARACRRKKRSIHQPEARGLPVERNRCYVPDDARGHQPTPAAFKSTISETLVPLTLSTCIYGTHFESNRDLEGIAEQVYQYCLPRRYGTGTHTRFYFLHSAG